MAIPCESPDAYFCAAYIIYLLFNLFSILFTLPQFIIVSVWTRTILCQTKLLYTDVRQHSFIICGYNNEIKYVGSG